MIWYLIASVILIAFSFGVFMRSLKRHHAPGTNNYTIPKKKLTAYQIAFIVGMVAATFMMAFAASSLLPGYSCVKTEKVERIFNINLMRQEFSFIDTQGHPNTAKFSNVGRGGVGKGDEVCVERVQNEIEWFTL